MKPEIFVSTVLETAGDFWDKHGHRFQLKREARTNIQSFFESVGVNGEVLAERAIGLELAIRKFNSNHTSGGIDNIEENSLRVAKTLGEGGTLPTLAELPADEPTIKLFMLGFLRQIAARDYRFPESVNDFEHFATAALVDGHGLAVTRILEQSNAKERVTAKTSQDIVGAVLENVGRGSSIEEDALAMKWYTTEWGFSELFLLDRFPPDENE